MQARMRACMRVNYIYLYSRACMRVLIASKGVVRAAAGTPAARPARKESSRSSGGCNIYIYIVIYI